jgi:hypothetical protein
MQRATVDRGAGRRQLGSVRHGEVGALGGERHDPQAEMPDDGAGRHEVPEELHADQRTTGRHACAGTRSRNP